MHIKEAYYLPNGSLQLTILITLGFSPYLVQNDGLWTCDDCHWSHKTPEWGDPEDPLDNPYLDEDVVRGYGPENINLSNPREGSYKVIIHYFGEQPRPTHVTVTLFSYGEQIGQFFGMLNEPETVWTVAEVSFPDASLEFIDETYVQSSSTRSRCSELR